MKKKSVLHLLVATGVVAILAVGFYRATHSSLFLLKEVEVVSLSDGYPLTQAQVLALAKVPVGQRTLFDVQLQPIETRLLKHAWVKGVVLGKQFPNSLSIKIVEREPVALLADTRGKVLYLEKDGTVFEDQLMVFARELPILSGFSGKDIEALKRADHFIQSWFSEERFPGLRLSSLSYDEKLGLKAVISYPMKNQQMMRAVLEMGLNIEEASLVPQQRLLKVLQYLSERSMRASKIWLGDGKKIVVKVSRGS